MVHEFHKAADAIGAKQGGAPMTVFGKLAGLLSTTAVLLAAGPAAAQSFPTQPVQLVVNFDAGGANDLAARAIQPALTRSLGQPVVVINKPGAGGSLGVQEVLKANADGHTLLFLPSNNLIYEPNYRKTAAYGVESFDYICRVFLVPISLAVSPSAPFKDVKGLVEYAKANPQKVLFGIPALGGINHVSVIALQKATGTQFTRVPFTGAAPAMQALASGQIHVAADTPTTIHNAQMKPVAVFTKERSPEVPDVPTLKELGIDVMEFVGFAGIVGPRGLPAAVRAKLEGACKTALEDAEALAVIKRLNLRAAYLGAGEYQSTAAEASKTVRQEMQDAGLSAP